MFFPEYPEFGDNGLVQVSELPGSDGMSISFVQDKERMGRDVIYGSEEIELQFYSGEYEISEADLQMPDGRVAIGLTMGYEFLREIDKREGSEARVELRISDDNGYWNVGDLDLKNKSDDGYACIKCKVTRNQGRALISRNLETEIDLLSDKGIFDQPSPPIELYKMWYKPHPVRSFSTWKMKERQIVFAGGRDFRTFARESIDFGIKDSLVPASSREGFIAAVNDMKYIRFFDDAREVVIENTLDADFYYTSVGSTADQGKAFISWDWVLYEEPFTGLETAVDFGEVYYKEIIGAEEQVFHLPENLSFTLPFVGRGQVLAMYWQMGWEIENLTATDGMNDFITGVAAVLAVASPQLAAFGAIALASGLSESEVSQGPTFWDFRSEDIKITATTTGIPSAFSVARWEDVFKKQADAINGFPVTSSILGKGGEFHDVFIADGNRIKQRNDFPFVVKWKDNVVQLNAIRSDYQVNEAEIIIEPEPEYYRPVEIGAYLSDPDVEYAETFSDKNTVLLFQPKYANYEQGEDESSTIDAVCTEAQYHTGNRNAINFKSFNLPFTADVFAINKIQQNNIQVKQSTSTASDDKKCIFDCVPMLPGKTNTLTKRLAQRDVPGQPGVIEILNNDIEARGLPLNWQLIGMAPTFQILEGANAGTYTVNEIEPTVITATKQGGGAITSQNTIIQIEYVITGVQYELREDEGFTIIEGVEAAREYGNVRFSIRSIAQRWLKRLSCYGLWSKTGKAKKTYYKNNPKLISQFGDEPVLDHFADIDYITPDVSPRQITRKVKMDFAEATRLATAVSEDRGFVRFSDPTGVVRRVFLDDFKYLLYEGFALLSGECAYDPETLDITTIGEIVKINQFGYDPKIIAAIDYHNNGNFVRLLDTKSIPLTGIFRYDRVSFNGLYFTNTTEMATALQQLVK